MINSKHMSVTTQMPISVVMPIYNTPINYLVESINSVLNQTFKEFELLVVNDGSICNDFIDVVNQYHDSRIKLIHNKHNYIDSLNKGIKMSSGKYIVRLDSDDIMYSNRLQIQWDFMESHPDVDICGTWGNIYGDNSKIIQTPCEHSEIVSSLLLFNPLIHSSIIIRRNAISEMREIYDKNYLYAEDYKLWTELAIKKRVFYNLPNVLVEYRYSDAQITHKHQKDSKRISQKIKLEYVEYVINMVQIEKNEWASLLKELVSLVNDGKISYNMFIHHVYIIYNNFLNQ